MEFTQTKTPAILTIVVIVIATILKEIKTYFSTSEKGNSGLFEILEQFAVLKFFFFLTSSCKP